MKPISSNSTDSARREIQTGSALALVDPVDPAERLREEFLQWDALGDLVVDAAVDGDHVVGVADERGDGGGDGLLPRQRPVGELELAAGHAALDRLVDLVAA